MHTFPTIVERCRNQSLPAYARARYEVTWWGYTGGFITQSGKDWQSGITVGKNNTAEGISTGIL